MKISDTISLSTRMFKTRKMRTFLTILGVGVGIGTVLFLVSLGYGLQRVVL
ncbi:ABC transporter permease, partial [Candidatus Falkowbacteria bacterium]|nr:ABC transporter permease [Candidatus Falkowbacteria bacterium]